MFPVFQEKFEVKYHLPQRGKKKISSKVLKIKEALHHSAQRQSSNNNGLKKAKGNKNQIKLNETELNWTVQIELEKKTFQSKIFLPLKAKHFKIIKTHKEN